MQAVVLACSATSWHGLKCTKGLLHGSRTKLQAGNSCSAQADLCSGAYKCC